MSRDRLEALLAAFAGRSVLVVGDLMLDEYLWGQVNRISPEAPVMVVEVRETTHCLGGAGNVATNVQAMGGRALLAGVVGDDAPGRTLRATATDHGCVADGVIIASDRPTTVKTRIVAHSQQVVRVDREERRPLDAAVLARLGDFVRAHISQADAVLLSDYAKGALTDDLVRTTIRAAREKGKPVAANLKPPRIAPFTGATLLSLNLVETERAANAVIRNEDDLFAAGRAVRAQLECDALLVTRGPKGVCLFTKDADPLCIPALPVEVFDVAGAGDTVVAATTMALAAGASFREAAAVGNWAGNVKVTKLGVAPVSRDEIRRMAVSA